MIKVFRKTHFLWENKLGAIYVRQGVSLWQDTFHILILIFNY